MEGRSAERRILVLGYPKSGTTWVTRLTAELLGAPVKGFWGEPANDEIAIEGASRVSGFECSSRATTPTTPPGTTSTCGTSSTSRATSGMSRCRAHVTSRSGRGSRCARLALSLRKRLTGEAGKTRENARRLSETLRVLSDGDAWPSAWCAQPWDLHVADFLHAHAFVIRYEDLLAAPERECARLLRHLGIVRSRGQVLDAILTQSFVSAKRRFLATGQVRHARFLREGRSGEWTQRLSPEQSAFCAERFGPLLALLGYEPWRSRNGTRGAAAS